VGLTTLVKFVRAQSEKRGLLETLPWTAAQQNHFEALSQGLWRKRIERQTQCRLKIPAAICLADLGVSAWTARKMVEDYRDGLGGLWERLCEYGLILRAASQAFIACVAINLELASWRFQRLRTTGWQRRKTLPPQLHWPATLVGSGGGSSQRDASASACASAVKAASIGRPHGGSQRRRTYTPPKKRDASTSANQP
jgi:hypothetical protein